MNRILSLIFLSLGIVLIIYGLNSVDSIPASLSKLFSGTTTDKALWLLIGGVFAFGIGGVGLVFGPKPTWKRALANNGRR